MLAIHCSGMCTGVYWCSVVVYSSGEIDTWNLEGCLSNSMEQISSSEA
jgi:hypothetical protein